MPCIVKSRYPAIFSSQKNEIEEE